MKVTIEHFLDASDPEDDSYYHYEGDDYWFDDGEHRFRARSYVDEPHRVALFVPWCDAGTALYVRDAARYLFARGFTEFVCLTSSNAQPYQPVLFTPPLE